MFRRPPMRSVVVLLAAVALTGAGVTVSRGAPQDDPGGAEARSATDIENYERPLNTRELTPEDPVRPLLQAVRNAAAPLGQRQWGKTRAQELGLSTFERFDPRLFEDHRLQLVNDEFREGYSQTFVELPEAIFVTAMAMETPAAAKEFFDLQLEVLQMQLDVQSQREDTTIEVTFEDDIDMEGLDRSFEKRYEFALEEQSPTRFRVLWGQTGRFTFEVTFLQSSTTTETARAVLKTLAEQVARL